jgi:hypothetical protein
MKIILVRWPEIPLPQEDRVTELDCRLGLGVFEVRKFSISLFLPPMRSSAGPQCTQTCIFRPPQVQAL